MVNAPGISARAQLVQKRYDAGVNSGKLTPAEQELTKEIGGKIREAFNSRVSDGKLTLDERIATHEAMNRASAGLFALKHNLNVSA